MPKKTIWSMIIISIVLSLALPGVVGAAPPAQDGGQVYTVALADSMWSIAEKYLGNGAAYPAIVEATNKKNAEDSSFTKITDPGLIRPGWKLYIPSAEEAAEAMEAYTPAVASSKPMVWAVKTETRSGSFCIINR